MAEDIEDPFIVEEEEGIEKQVNKFFEELNIEEGRQRKRFRSEGLRVRKNL